MCGIAGYWSFKADIGRDEMGSITDNMARAITHRGPDDQGIWTDETAGISLGHRRLSIIDLSAAGHQPMISANERYVIVLNGEIYNYQELRAELITTGLRFRGNSDTEVAINAIQQWGIDKALARFVGMYAMAIWDRESKILSLVRDRLGEKPLYYGWIETGFVFASELKAIQTHPHWKGVVNRNALAMLLEYTYIPSPFCIYEGISRLQPGSILEITFPLIKKQCRTRIYWSVDDVVRNAVQNERKPRDLETASRELEQVLETTLHDKMISDVPVGAFLSGGIDSSLVVALMQSQSTQRVKTFSIGFHEPEFNEAVYAKQVAMHLGTDHTELYVSPEQALAIVPRLSSIYDEPFADSSQIPTFLISELARQKVTVALSGDGGDELFGGYNRYIAGSYILDRIRSVPEPLRRVAAAMMTACPPSAIDTIYNPVSHLLPSRYRYQQFGAKLHKLAGMLNNADPDGIYRGLVTMWQDPGEVVTGCERTDLFQDKRPLMGMLTNFSERMMYADTISYLPDDILVKVDRASMAASLEVRVPLLDHRIIEWVWNQPPELKLHQGEGKRLLRKILNRYVPEAMIDRPKMGFGIPIGDWLKGPLREWADDLLSYDRLNRQGYFRPEVIRQKWHEHLGGRNAWHYQLWPVLMFQAWHQQWIGD